jgi:hypothetical protein
MTYRALLAQLQALTEGHLDTEIQYQDTNTGEFLGVRGLGRLGDYDEESDPLAPILEI